APADGRTMKWRAAKMDSDGVLATQSIAGGGYAITQVDSPAAGVMLLRASGHAAVYVNGELRAGDVYRLGDFDLPIELRRRTNELVFHVYQPELHAALARPECPIFMASERAVVPTSVVGAQERVWVGIPTVNATSEAIGGAKLVV